MNGGTEEEQKGTERHGTERNGTEEQNRTMMHAGLGFQRRRTATTDCGHIVRSFVRLFVRAFVRSFERGATIVGRRRRRSAFTANGSAVGHIMRHWPLIQPTGCSSQVSHSRLIACLIACLIARVARETERQKNACFLLRPCMGGHILREKERRKEKG